MGKRIRCSFSDPNVNAMLIKIAQEEGISTVNSGPLFDSQYPYMYFVDNELGQCNKDHPVDEILGVEEFIKFLKRNTNVKKTTFGKFDVKLTKTKLQVGCHEFGLKEVRKMKDFLNKNLK